MRLASFGGNRYHAPSWSRVSFLSAYTSGADVLGVPVCASSDGQLVVGVDDALSQVTGLPGNISNKTLAELKLVDLGALFNVRGSTATPYKQDPPDAKIESLGAMLDALPSQAKKLLRPHGPATLASVPKIVTAVGKRGLEPSVWILSSEAPVLDAFKSAAPGIGRFFRAGTAGEAQAPPASAQGLALELPLLLDANAQPTALVQALANANLPLGVIVSLPGNDGVPTVPQVEALKAMAFVYAVGTSSTLDLAAVRGMRKLEEASFDGEAEDSGRFKFGYAKASSEAWVHQKDGVHLEIGPCPVPAEFPPTNDPVRKDLNALREAAWFASRSWPFYAGGGFGMAAALEGDFAVEVDFQADKAQQATMWEMAVTNVDPGKHHPGWIDKNGTLVPNRPKDFRDKDSFFDPHGCPPFVGSEHDEDDGYRINHNLGSEYDNNRYGRPIGNGKTLTGRLRLERRGQYFSTYYKDAENPDWVCSGSIRNASMNSRVFVRCSGKRWRQESADPATQGAYFPIPENHIIFRNFVAWTSMAQTTHD